MCQWNLMPFQDLPFNGDTFVQSEFLKLRDQFNIKNVVETGSCLFTTTKWFSDNFDSVYTFEIVQDFYNYGMEITADRTNINAFRCHSPDGLKLICDQIVDETIFFLDAHWGDACPLLEEIEQIAKFRIDPIIVIHDFKTDNPNLGFDSFKESQFDLNFVNHSLSKVYPNGFDYYFNDEACGAMRGMIYILPPANRRYINRRIQGI